MESSSQLINVSDSEEISTRHDQKKESKQADDDDDDERSPSWADIPGDALNFIFSHLFNFDCIRFRLTCKAWRFANKIPLIHPPPSILIQQLEYYYYYSSRRFPWLMFFSKPKSSGIFDFFHPVTNETYTMHIPELANSVFRCSRYGWLLMSRGTHSFFFYNPFIPNSTINLPDFHEHNDHPNFISMSFTAPPTSPDCIVFAHMNNLTYIYTCRRGEDHWSTEYNINYIQTIHYRQAFKAFHCTPVSRKGVFYQVDIKGRLGASDMKELLEDGNPPRLKELPKPTEPSIPDIVSDYNNYIAEVDGEFVSVFVDPIVGYPVHVFKLDWSKMEWVTVKSLGNKTMFISETTGCLLVAAAETTYQNKIYFPKFRNKKGGQHHLTKDKACVFYSLETRKYHAFGCDFSIEGSDEMEALPNSVWIEPNVNNTHDGVEDNW